MLAHRDAGKNAGGVHFITQDIPALAGLHRSRYARRLAKTLCAFSEEDNLMAKKSIASVGIEIPGADINRISLRSKTSLLDYDVIIVDPHIYDFYGYNYDNYQGKPCLDDTNSFRLKDHLEHWRREILEAVKAG